MIKLLLLSLFIAFFVSCGETRVTGGVSEETNTVAGLLENTNGPVRGVTVLACIQKTTGYAGSSVKAFWRS